MTISTQATSMTAMRITTGETLQTKKSLTSVMKMATSWTATTTTICRSFPLPAWVFSHPQHLGGEQTRMPSQPN